MLLLPLLFLSSSCGSKAPIAETEAFGVKYVQIEPTLGESFKLAGGHGYWLFFMVGLGLLAAVAYTVYKEKQDEFLPNVDLSPKTLIWLVAVVIGFALIFKKPANIAANNKKTITKEYYDKLKSENNVYHVFDSCKQANRIIGSAK